MNKLITADSIYLTKEDLWLCEGGNTPWQTINRYGDIKKIYVSNSTIIIQFSKRYELEIPRNQCWIGYKLGHCELREPE